MILNILQPLLGIDLAIAPTDRILGGELVVVARIGQHTLGRNSQRIHHQNGQKEDSFGFRISKIFISLAKVQIKTEKNA